MQYLPNPIWRLKLKLNMSSPTQYLLLYRFYGVVGFDIKSLFLVDILLTATSSMFLFYFIS